MTPILGQAAVSGFKSLGDAGWVGFFSNIFPDRDVLPDAPQGERFTLAAHQEYAVWANSDEKNLPELWFGHLPNVKMGKATAVEVVGPFIVAVGQWGSDDVGQKAKAFFAASEDDWAMSHGFKYRVGDRIAGEYQKYRSYEVTVLPPTWASNPVTAFMEGMDMTTKGLRDELAGALRNILGISAEEAGKAVEIGMEQEKARKAKLGDGEQVAHKDAETPAAPATPADPTAEEAVSDDTLALALADALIAVQEGEAKRIALDGEVKALKAKLEALETTITGKIKALEDEAAARKNLLPRAVAQAIQQRASEKGAEVSAQEVTADAAKQAEQLGSKGEIEFDKDPFGWVAAQAGIDLGAPPQKQ